MRVTSLTSMRSMVPAACTRVSHGTRSTVVLCLAMTAGVHQTKGDAVVVIDVDLQDPPELIPSSISEWQTGHRD